MDTANPESDPGPRADYCIVEPEGIDLVVPTGWSILDASEDPFPEHRLPTHECEPGGVHPENDVLEIETKLCGYAIAGQPLLVDIEEGDWVEMLFFHTALFSLEEPAAAHIHVTIDDNLVWERTVDIPAAAEVYIIPQQVTWSAAAGSMVRIHLHNHGFNSYALAYLKKLADPEHR